MIRKQYKSLASQTKSPIAFSFVPKTGQIDKQKNFSSITELFPFASGVPTLIYKFVDFCWLILLIFRGIACLCQWIAVERFACQCSFESCIASISCIDFTSSLHDSIRQRCFAVLLTHLVNSLLPGLSVSRIWLCKQIWLKLQIHNWRAYYCVLTGRIPGFLKGKCNGWYRSFEKIEARVYYSVLINCGRMPGGLKGN